LKTPAGHTSPSGVNDHLCTLAVWLTQMMLLGSRSDMDEIAEAIRKIHGTVPQ